MQRLLRCPWEQTRVDSKRAAQDSLQMYVFLNAPCQDKAVESLSKLSSPELKEHILTFLDPKKGGNREMFILGCGSEYIKILGAESKKNNVIETRKSFISSYY